MYLNRKIQRSLVIMLMISLLSLLIPQKVHATTANLSGNGDFKVLSDNKIEYSDDTEKSEITMNETDTKFNVTVVNENTGKRTYFIGDKTTGTIYSSETNQTVDISELIENSNSDNIRQTSNQLKSASASSSGYVGKIKKKISYKKLSDFVTATSTAASIAGAILTILGMMGLAVVNSISAIVSIIGGIISVIQIGIGKKSAKHGITVTLKKYRHVRHRAGKRLVRYSYNMSGVAKY